MVCHARIVIRTVRCGCVFILGKTELWDTVLEREVARIDGGGALLLRPQVLVCLLNDSLEKTTTVRLFVGEAR